VRISVCHCLACQKRSGSSYAAQARFPAEQVSFSGESSEWQRTGDEGGVARFRFCPNCGSTLSYVFDNQPELVAVAIGAFADPAFPPPEYSIYEERKHAWVAILGDDIEHYD